MNPSRTTRVPHPHITNTRQGICKIFNLVKRTLDLALRGSPWHGKAKSVSENLGGNKIFENDERKNNFEVERVWCKNSVMWNQKYSNSIHIDPNKPNSNQPIPSDLINIGSIHDSDDIIATEKISSSPVHLVQTPSPVPASLIFTYGTSSDTQSPSYYSSAESMTPK